MLTILGSLGVYSASSIKGYLSHQSTTSFMFKHLMGVLCCYIMFGFAYLVPKRVLLHLALPFLLLSFLFLTLSLLPGFTKTSKGAARWIVVFGFSFQPTEISKIAILFFTAKLFSKPYFTLERFSVDVILYLLILFFHILVMIKQPDFGTAVLLGLTSLFLCYIKGLKTKILTGIFILHGVLAGLLVTFAPYRMQRIYSYLDPWNSLSKGGFQIIQSFVSFEKGGLWGQGIGESRQKLFFLPEAHTDFIYSVLGEEFGLFGSLFIILLYLGICILGYQIVKKETDLYFILLASGIVFLFTSQCLFNLSVVTGLLPTKGISLPLISNGLSSYLSFSFLLSCLACMARDQRIDEKRVP